MILLSLQLPVYGLPAEPKIDPATELVDNSGQEKIITIMSQISHNKVVNVKESIEFLRTENIDKDLNLQAIADYFAPKTVIGNIFLKETLSRPVLGSDQSGIVALRKNIIARLVEDPKFKQKIDAILDEAAEQEKVATELLSEGFKGKTCGSDLKKLENLKKDTFIDYHLYKFGVYNTSFRTFCLCTSGIMFFSSLAASAVFRPLIKFKENKFNVSNSTNFLEFLKFYGFINSLLLCYLFGESLYKELSKAGEKRVIMRSLNKLIHGAQEIEFLCNGMNLDTQFKISSIKNKECLALLEGLQYSRYEDKTNYFFHVPAVHTLLYQVYDHENKLGPLFASIAEMDACNAIATKILESKNSARQFCFAQPIESTKPQINSVNFWNVLVPNAVPNSIDFNQHIILTGPNAGGKTTSIRANLQNIVLAQTYGVAAAESFVYTPFDIILSYLNISDDLVNGLSLFASEIKRAQELLELIKTLQPGQKLFFALDELFTGTAAEQGEKCAYEFIKKIAGYENTLFVYATHFNKLKELGDQSLGLMNYKVDAPDKNQAGKLVYPFTLSPGASSVNIAEDMAKEAGLFD